MRGRLLAALLVCGAVASAAWAPPAPAVTGATPAAVTVTKSALAPGLTYRKIQDPAGPWTLHVLTVDPSRRISLDTVAAAPSMGRWARTSAMAADAGALAAINGDFSVWPGHPSHPFAMDGALQTTGLRAGVTFGIRQDETASSIRHATPHIWAKDLSRRQGIGVASWNMGAPTAQGIAGFTSYGGEQRTPPARSCSVQLRPSAKLRWTQEGTGVSRDYTVKARRCRDAAMEVRPGNVVLSSRLTGAGATWIKGLKRAGTVRVSWDAGMPGTLDVIGGNPRLVKGGRVMVSSTCATWFCRRNPRTAIGVTATGRVLLVVVDGRTTDSVGMTLFGLATTMKSLGAVSAINLDGGGSATMWIRGQGVVSRPSDRSGERPVTNALVVLPGADAGEPVPLAYQRGSALALPGVGGVVSSSVSWAEGQAAMDAAASDPASTGGLMDWLVGSGVSSDPEAVRIALAFRSTR